MADKMPETSELKCPVCGSIQVYFKSKMNCEYCRRCGQHFIYTPTQTQAKTKKK